MAYGRNRDGESNVTNLELRNEKIVVEDDESSRRDDDGDVFHSLHRLQDLLDQRHLRRAAQAHHVEVAFLQLLCRHCYVSVSLFCIQNQPITFDIWEKWRRRWWYQGFKLGMRKQLTPYSPWGDIFEFYKDKTFQTLRPLEVCLVVNFKILELIEIPVSWSRYLVMKGEQEENLVKVTEASFYGSKLFLFVSKTILTLATP